MIRDMVRLSLWGVQSKKKEIVRELFALGVLHLDQDTPSTAEDDGTFNSLKLLRGKVLGLIEALGWDGWNSLREEDLGASETSLLDLSSAETVHEIDRSLEAFTSRLASLLAEAKEKDDLLDRLNRSEEVLRKFTPFFSGKAPSETEEDSLWWVENGDAPALVASLAAALDGGERHEAVSSHFVAGKESFGLLGLRTSLSAASIVRRVASESGAMPWRPPEYRDAPPPFGKLLPDVQRAIEGLSARRSAIEEELRTAALQWGPRLAALYLFIDEKTEEASVEAQCRGSEESFSIGGWVPGDALHETARRMEERFGTDVLMQWRLPGEDEWKDVPTALKNAPLASPFELFLRLLRPPTYDGVDPTPMVALFFPFFSGCMIGDVGYGVLFLLLALWLKGRKLPVLRDVAAILTHVALWSILWGLAWGEFFGDVGHRLFHMKPLLVERTQGILPVMIFTVSLGLFHVLLGLFIGLCQGVRHHHRHLWMEKAGNMLFLIGLIVAILFLKTRLPKELFTVPVSFLVIGIALLVGGGGIGGIVEAFGSIGNVISYVRIAAIGLSSAILAMVASKFTDVLGLSVLGLILAFIIHLLNLVIAIGGSSLHSARLHYVEFFGRFYSAGGKNYTPFRKRSGLTWKKR